MSELERRRLAPRVMKFFRGVREAYVGRVTGKPWSYGDDQKAVLAATQVLVLGTATASELRKAGAWGVPDDELAVETLKHRPEVVTALVEAIAGMTPTRWMSRFSLMRALVREGVVETPRNPGYILAMINGLDSRKTTVLDALRADPGLLEDEVWRLFEVEGAGETSLAAHDKYSSEARTWSTALSTLSEEGALSRQRMLDDTLTALRADWAPFRAGWLSRFHEQLEPTLEERRARRPAYVALLASPVPATVSFATRALVAIGKVSDSDLDRLGPSLVSKATATVKGAIKLLPKSERGAAVAAAALPHATRDGQIALLAFIESTGAKVSQPAPARVPERPVVYEPAELAPSVESVGELIELLATLLEHIEDAHDVERALDATSRLCNRDELTLRRLEPVAKRATKVLTASRAFAGESPRADIAGLVIAWSTGRVPPVPLVRGPRASPFLVGRNDVPGPRKSVLGFLSSRVMEIATRAARGERAPILSLPTRHGGAIDPEVLASRRLHINAARFDGIQAALRVGDVKPAATIRLLYESPTTKHFQLIVDPQQDGQPDLANVPGLFVAALSGPYGSLDRGTIQELDVASQIQRVNQIDVGSAEAVRWVGTVWPANREPFYAMGATELGSNLDWWEARWHARCYLEPLLLPAEPIGEMGRLLLALGLAAKEPGEHGLATDALIRAVAQSRIDAGALGDILGRLYDHGEIKGSRIAATLADAARVSVAHAAAVATALERVLAALHGPAPADVHAVLTALSDSLASAGRRLDDPGASAYLSAIRGSGKAAATAWELLNR